MNETVKLVVVIILSSLVEFFLLSLAYRKGREDERYAQKYLCPDCGDLKEDEAKEQCNDCCRKYWGEMMQG